VVKSDEDVLIASAVGEHSFYIYDTARLNLAYMSKYIPEKILWIEASADGFVYTAHSDHKIVCWKKMHKVLEFCGHQNEIIKFIIGGDFVFSLAEAGEFIAFNRKNGSIAKKMTMPGTVCTFMHPITYVNKLLFGGEAGSDETEEETVQDTVPGLL